VRPPLLHVLSAALVVLAATDATGGAVTPSPEPTAVMPTLTPMSGDAGLRPTEPWAPAPVRRPPLGPLPDSVPGPASAGADVAASSAVPTVEPTTKPAPASIAPREMWTVASVRLRAGPSTDTRVVDELTADTRVSPSPGGSIASEWIKVRAGNSTGWLKSSYLTVKAPASSGGGDCGPTTEGVAPLAPGASARGIDESVRMRAGPGCSEKVLDQLEEGVVVKVIGVEGDWYAVAGQEWERVYIHRGLLVPVR